MAIAPRHTTENSCRALFLLIFTDHLNAGGRTLQGLSEKLTTDEHGCTRMHTDFLPAKERDKRKGSEGLLLFVRGTDLDDKVWCRQPFRNHTRSRDEEDEAERDVIGSNNRR